jgi:hypothetical protein
LEVGKIKAEGDGEVQEMIDMADFAVGLSRMLYGQTMQSERARHRMYEQWHPLGVVGVITAFNFPVAVWAWNAFLAAVTGNTVLWKPSPKAPLCALAVQRLCNRVLEEAGYPGVFALLTTDRVELAERIRESERARKADEKASREENFPSKWTPGSFDVATANGKRGVDGFRRGAFGYHESGDGYTVTHVPTGMAIHTAKGPAIAKRFINDIHKHEGLDWTSSNPDVYRRDHGAVIKRIKAEHAAGDAAVDAAVSAPTGQERSSLTTRPSIPTRSQSAKRAFSPRRAMARSSQRKLYPAAHSTGCSTSPSDPFSQFRRSPQSSFRCPITGSTA